MKKLVRILYLLEQIRHKKNLRAKIRLQLMYKLIHLELYSFLQSDTNKEITTKILDFNIHAYGYKNLCILFREIFIKEEYQYFTSKEDTPIIIDCGANIGIATLYFKWKFPQCIIHAFEPDPSAFILLEKNVATNGFENVQLYNQAAMDKAGTIQFYKADQIKASLMMSTIKERINESVMNVEGIDFPAFVKKSNASLMKIDIEGAETSVLERMHIDTGFGTLKQILMEYHHKIDGHVSNLSRVFEILEQHQFEYNIITEFDKPGKFQDILIYAYRD